MKTDVLVDAIGMMDEKFVDEAGRTSPNKRRSPGKVILAIAAAMILAFAASLSAMAAADVDGAYQLLYALSPSVAQILKPVNMSCEDEGVRMEVISADLSGDEAYIYISVEDMVGDRIDGTIDLYDSYDINRAFDCAASCELVNYDENTGKAVFLIHMENMNKGEKIRDGKITFSVRTLLSGKEVICGELPIDLTAAAREADAQVVSPELMRGTGSNGEYPDSTRFLAPVEGGVYTPGDGAQITAMGYIDGRLHIQTRFDRHRDGKWYYDNHGFLSLLNEKGEEIPMDCFEFWGGEVVTRRTDWQVFQGHECFYQEYIAEIPPEELENCRLNGDFWLCDTAIDGRWQVTFPLENNG